MAAPVFRPGDRGPAVAEIKARLARLGFLPGSGHVRPADPLDVLLHMTPPDHSVVADPSQWETTALVSAEYDTSVERAVRAFQADRGITVDGLVGPETFQRLEEARWQLGDRVLSFSARHVFVGDDVLQLQRRLNQMGFSCGREDSHFGPSTDRGVREFQRNVGLDTDGICGPITLRALGRLHRTVGTESAQAARERYGLSGLQTGIAGKRIVLDPGHGGPDHGLEADGATEEHITATIAALIGSLLAAQGADVITTRPPGTDGGSRPLTERDRADFCNAADADLVVSLHLSRSGGPDDSPRAAVHYYGRSPEVFSATGSAVADHVRDCISTRVPGADCRTENGSWDLLRMTRMPAVRVEIGPFPGRGFTAVADASFQADLARAIASGVADFFAPVPAEAETVQGAR